MKHFLPIIIIFCLLLGLYFIYPVRSLLSNGAWTAKAGDFDAEKPKITILNVHSHPQAGDNWTVSFETKGVADLTITPNDQAMIDDLDFVSLTCDGEEEITPQILEGDIVFYPNWQCEGTGEVTHLVNVARKHILKFQFDDQIAYAYNSPAFPQVAAVNGGNNPVDSTEHTVNLPADIASGDLLLVFFASHGTPTITFPEGWTRLFTKVRIAVKFEVWYRIADGEEEATITVTTSISEMSAHTSYRITGYSGTPEAGAGAVATDDNPNPPSLTPSWGAKDTLWFAACGYDESNGSTVVDTYPTNYTNGRNDHVGIDDEGCGTAVARRELNAASEDPGTFDLTQPASRWVANTVAIQPSVSLQGSEQTFTVNNVAPVVSNVKLNNSNSIDLSSGGEGPDGNINIDVTADVNDDNGCADVTTVTAKAYYRDADGDPGAAQCTGQDNNNCYFNISCTGGGCSGGVNEAYTCTANFKYHANPTSAATPWADYDWRTTVTAPDEAESHSLESSGVELSDFLALTVSAIAYGDLKVGEITGGTNLPKQSTVKATGNCGLDVKLGAEKKMCTDYDTCVEDATHTPIAQSQQKYGTSATTWTDGAALSSSVPGNEYELNCKKTTETATPEDEDVYWGLQIPDETLTGGYSGTNTFTGLMAETGDWWPLNATTCNALTGWAWINGACWSHSLVTGNMPWSDTGVNDSDDPGTYTCASLATYDLQTRMEAAINQDWTKIITLDADKSALAIADCIDGTIDLCEGTLSDGCLGSSFKTINESLEAWALADGKSALPLPSSNGGDPNYTYTTNHYDEACSWWDDNYPDTDIDIAGPDDDFWLNHQAHGGDPNYNWGAACGSSGGYSWGTYARVLGRYSCSSQNYLYTSNAGSYYSFRAVVRP